MIRDSATNPDTSVVRFRYDARQRITARTDRRGLLTAYGYARPGVLVRSGTLVGTDSTVITYSPAEGVGPYTSVGAEDVATVLDGPRRDVADVVLDESTRSYYDAEGRLRAVDRRRCIAWAPEPVSMTRLVCVGWEHAPSRGEFGHRRQPGSTARRNPVQH